jgi:hypothetical protein
MADQSGSEPQLPPSEGLTEFRRKAAAEDRLSETGMRQIVAAALDLLGDYYVHLPHKRAMHATDPLQRLRLLRQRVRDLRPRAFHDEMLEIFAGLRDRHTLYYVRKPYRGMIAALPFRVQACVDQPGATRRRFVVTEVAEAWLPDRDRRVPFEPGVEITHWNATPIERVVDQNARRQGGSNPYAQIARSIAYLTDRVLTFSPLPEEDWVELRYRHGRRSAQIRLDWRVYALDRTPEGELPKYDPRAAAIDRITEGTRRGRNMRFRAGVSPPALPDERRPAEEPPDAVSAQVIEHGGRRYGHLRLWTFDVPDARAFLEEVLAKLRELDDTDGLIVDVRGNGGGNFAAGERLLQLFTPWRIEPERVQFLNTDATRFIAGRSNSNFSEWRPSLRRAVRTGEAYSDGLPLEPGHAASCNFRGQHYHGPVVLIVDALCYSTTDAFAAGFQDNRAGRVLGTDGCTGAGGGNPWPIEYIAGEGDHGPWKLPGGTTFDVAVRRNVRVGRRAGLPIEDLGVLPDVEHALTRRDVLEGNQDLFAKAIEMLAAGRRRRLDLSVELRDHVAHVELDTREIAEVDLYLDGRPAANVGELGDGKRTVELEAAADRTHELLVYGFAGGRRLVAARRTRFGTGPFASFQVEMTPLPTTS